MECFWVQVQERKDTTSIQEATTDREEDETDRVEVAATEQLSWQYIRRKYQACILNNQF